MSLLVNAQINTKCKTKIHLLLVTEFPCQNVQGVMCNRNMSPCSPLLLLKKQIFYPMRSSDKQPDIYSHLKHQTVSMPLTR